MVLLDRVRSQYERLPYPHRDPEDERSRLLEGLMGRLTLANHLLWGGGRSYGADFAVLDAGCGTGDGTLYMAEQLRGTRARVVALDFSSASLDVARARAAVRGLDNIEFVQASIEEMPGLGLGRFDYIISVGVLHHLASPEDGLATLRDALKPDGGIGVMVYGLYGRQPVYLVQELMRYLAPPEMDDGQRLAVLKRTLKVFPQDHRVMLALKQRFGGEMERSEAGLFDLLLHAQDRAYTVPQIYEWLEGAGMRLLSWGTPVLYEAATHAGLGDAVRLEPRQRHAVAELLHGALSMHSFFATRESHATPSPPDPDDDSAVPAWTDFDFDGKRAAAIRRTGRGDLTFVIGNVQAAVKADALTRALLGRVDGRTPVRAIVDGACEELPAVSRAQAQKAWRQTFRALNSIFQLVLDEPRALPRRAVA